MVSKRSGRALALTVLVMAAAGATSAEAGSGGRPTAIVSLGDSFISGEAGRWQGNSLDPSGDRSGTDRACVRTLTGCEYDPSRVYVGGTHAPEGCHRSDVAEILSARIRIDQRINIACQGAQTPNIVRASRGGKREKGEPPQADQLLPLARSRRIRLIALLIGGNDLGFGDAATDCVLRYVRRAGPCRDVQQANVGGKMPMAMAGVAKAIDEVRAVMRIAGYRRWHYRIVLQSYPSPLPRASENRYPEQGAERSNVGCPFYDVDSDWARDSVVPQIANNLSAVARSKGVQFMDLRNALEDREICSRSTRLADASNPPSGSTSEWARVIGAHAIGQGFFAEQFHPNAFGQKALGTCLTLIVARRTGSFACTNTLGRGTDAMSLRRVSDVPGRFRMRLRVRPRRLVAGNRTCFRFKVVSGGERVEGVTIRLAGRRVRTSRRGRARRCMRLGAGRYRARARRPGFRPTSARIRVRG